MMEALGPDFSTISLGDLVADAPMWPLESRAVIPPYPYPETTLVATVRRAWHKPLVELSGHEFRTLISQGFGLRWLAGPALDIATRHPTAYFSNYEGELAYAILSHAEEINQVEPEKLRKWLDTDLSSLANIIEPEDVGQSALRPSFRELLPAVRSRFCRAGD